MEVINLMRLCQQVIIWCLLGSFFHKEYKKPDVSRSFFMVLMHRICAGLILFFPFD
jgi:hypothetical protein